MAERLRVRDITRSAVTLLLCILATYCLEGEGDDNLHLPVSLRDWHSCPSSFVDSTPSASPDGYVLAHNVIDRQEQRHNVMRNELLTFFNARHLADIPVFHAVNNELQFQQLMTYLQQGCTNVIVDTDVYEEDGRLRTGHPRSEAYSTLTLPRLIEHVVAAGVKGVHLDSKNRAVEEDIIALANTHLQNQAVFYNFSFVAGPGAGRPSEETAFRFMDQIKDVQAARPEGSPPVVLMATWTTRANVESGYQFVHMQGMIDFLVKRKYQGPVMFAVDAEYFMQSPELIAQELLQKGRQRGLGIIGFKLYARRPLFAHEFAQIQRLVRQYGLEDDVLYELTLR